MFWAIVGAVVGLIIVLVAVALGVAQAEVLGVSPDQTSEDSELSNILWR